MKLCAPVIIYTMFCLVQILIDLLEGLYNSAGVKLIISIAVTGLLYFLCSKGYLLISWIIVLIPFLFMSFLTTVLLYKLKLHSELKKPCDAPRIETTILNEPRYKHGYTHLYKYTTTPVKMRFEPVRKCEEEKEEEERTSINYKNKYIFDSDPEYESFK